MVKRKLNKNKSTKKAATNKRRQHAVAITNNSPLSRFHYSVDKEYVAEICTLTDICPFCNAKLFSGESRKFCCGEGDIELESLPPLPNYLFELLENSAHFLAHIRKYNNAFAMTSLGCEETWDYLTFKISGKMCHRIGALIPASQESPQFLQIYFLGNADTEVETRQQNTDSHLNLDVLKQLQHMMHVTNVYVLLFKSAYERGHQLEGNVQVVIRDSTIPSVHRGRSNAPTTDEVAVFIAGNAYCQRDIIVQFRDADVSQDGRIYKRINETHKSYDPLQYPLLFPHGNDGYHINILKKYDQDKRVSAAEFYVYRLMVRDDNHLLLFRQLLNVYIVDMWAKIESERLLYIRLHQKQLRVESYIHLRDAFIHDQTTMGNIGKMVILPSSFTGSPRYMMEKTQDALCYVRKFGSPHLFITMTCNPNWEDIKNNIHPGQRASDRYDIVSRVFHLKVKQLKTLLMKKELFGQMQCYLYTIEWQKRGLPHVHLLLWLKIPIRPDEIDSIISAELPDPTNDPKLFEIVSKHMIHTPCGVYNVNAPCMDNKKCTKRFPREFISETVTDVNSYPLYRRRNTDNGGVSYQLPSGIVITNQWVVPHNPILCRTFQCHINVEYCHSVKAIKYICKYVCKGHDMATLTYKYDEIERYLNGRYISTSEAVWRIFQFPVHERFPAVIHLNVHLPNGQRVYFHENNVLETINNPKKTTLLAFFELCTKDKFACTLLYSEVPSYYTWNGNSFRRRKQGSPVEGYPGIKYDQAIGRMYTISPRDRECFFLRLLLHNVRGPTSFTDLRTVNDVVYINFEEACRARGLLINDKQWEDTMREACLSATPRKLRELYVMIVVHCSAANPLELWEKFKNEMSDDIRYSIEQIVQSPVEFNAEVFNTSLLDIQETLSAASGGKSMTDYGLPTPTNESVSVSQEYFTEKHFDRSTLEAIVNNSEVKLNTEQKNAYDTILNDIHHSLGKTYYLDAPGGTGKTFLLNVLLSKVRLAGHIAIGVASSGIAATLILNGRTAHSAFKLPLDLAKTGESGVCNIPKNSTRAQILRECKLIIWDEVTMSHKVAFETLDRSLRDIRSTDCLMGGITVLLTGDFCQTLPVIPRGTRADTVHASLKFSTLWPSISVLPPLRTNMRLKDNNTGFAKLLETIGNGLYPNVDSYITASQIRSVVDSLEHLINEVWEKTENIVNHSSDWINQRAILSPRNNAVNTINQLILDGINSPEIVYKSTDRTTDETEAIHFPVEFLESIEDAGLPPHVLKLKIGVPVILIRNLQPPKLCNGTRVIIVALGTNVIQATILSGVNKGDTVFIPRIPLTSLNIPFSFVRLQFPLKLCFALSINKAQGQTFEKVGIYLHEQCFSHGQLYVALSRITSQRGLYIYSKDGQIQNVVYNEVLGQ